MISMQMTRIVALWMAGLLILAQSCMAMVVGYSRAGRDAWTTILADGFDADLSLWTSETDINIIGAVSGSAYVVTMTAPAQAAYLNKTFASPAPYPHVQWDFYVLLSDVTAVGNAVGQTIRIAQGGNSSNDTMFSVSARCSSAAGDIDQVQFGFHSGMSSSIINNAFAWVAGQSHHVVAEYYSADGGIGFAKLSVDGVQLVHITGLSNGSRTFDRAKLGVVTNTMGAAPASVSVQGVSYATM